MKKPIESTTLAAVDVPNAGPVVPLSVHNHDRDSAGLVYVYPVLSRRAGGLSIGINLNPNNACNWRCVYCQVPNLTRGSPPRMDRYRFADEFERFLVDVREGDFWQRSGLPPEAQTIRDVAISGNGEPTANPDLAWTMAEIDTALARHRLGAQVKRVLISNGSLVKRPPVQDALKLWGGAGGELWFKVDSATTTGTKLANDVQTSVEGLTERVALAARLCPTWIQSCFFAWDGKMPDTAEIEAYLAWLERLRLTGVEIQGVLLYGVARPSLQPEAPRISPLPKVWFEAMERRISQLGVSAKVSV